MVISWMRKLVSDYLSKNRMWNPTYIVKKNNEVSLFLIFLLPMYTNPNIQTGIK